jgi:hypothetical protein
VEVVGASGEQPVWAGLAAPDIVLVLFETATGDKLLAYTPRPTSAPTVNVGTAEGETERKRDLRWSVDSLQTFTPRFTPDRQLIAYWADGAVRFANPATGKLVSSLPSQATRVGSGIAFDEPCKRAAVVWRDLHLSFISVYDLATGKTIAEFPLGSGSSVAPRRWLGANDVLLDDGSVFDIKRGGSIWQYEYANRLIQAVPHPDERFWFLTVGVKGEPLLAAKTLPGAEELAGAGGASGAFAATKGMPVSVQLDLSGPSEGADAYRRRVLGKVEARLRAFGMVPTANAPAKLKVSASFQDTGEFARVTNAYGGSPGNGDDKVALKTLSGSVVLNDGAGSPPVKLKTFAVETPAHDKMPLKAGKGPADILQDMQWDNLEGEVDDFVLPEYIGRAPTTVRQSKLEP